MDFTKIWDFISRHSIWAIAVIFSLSMLAFSPQVLWTVFYIILGESLALSLSNVGQYVFTKINFVKMFDKGDEPLSKIAHAIIIGSIFIGVHLLVGYSMYGIFLANNVPGQ